MIIYITFLAVIFSLVALGSYWAALRTVGVKANLVNVLKLTIALLVLLSVVVFIGYLLDSNLINFLLGPAWIISSFTVWYKFLNQHYKVSLVKGLWSYIIAGIIANIASVVLAVGVIGFVQSYKIGADIMSPALKQGDTVLVYKINKNLEVNKIVIYKYEPDNKHRRVIGRILYQPGQTIEIKTSYINAEGSLKEPGNYTLKGDEYYIVGDNQDDAPPKIVNESDIIAVVGPTIVKAK